MRILRILLILAIASFAQAVFAGGLGEADLRALGITDATGALPPLTSNSVTWSWVHGPIRYDGSGNISSIGDQTFLYDTQNRLTRAEITRPDQPGSQVETYSYDAFGNMTTKTRNGNGVGIPTNAGTNRLNGWVLYDAAGNLTRWQGDNAQVYLARYDALNRLQELKLDNTTNDARHVYLYTADGERIWSWNVYANVSEWNLRGPDNSVLRTFTNAGASWSLDRDYIYRDGQMLAAITPTQTLHFSLDHLGTPRVITDDSRIRVGFHHYFPFGEEWSINDGAQEGEHKKFTGHERDTDIAGAATGLDYMHARYYRAGVGRFLSIDPVLDIERASKAPQGWNRYAYVINNPLKSVDPDGKDVIVVTTYDGPRTGGLGHTSWLFQDSKGNWYEYQQATDDSAWKALFGVAKGEADLRQVAGPDISSKEMASTYHERYGADTSILKTTRKEDGKIIAAAKESVKAHQEGKKYSLLTNNCGQAGISILHKAGFTGAPSGSIPSLLGSALDLWFKAVNNGLLKKTEELPLPVK
jgi:RHS repeat-associated protein